MKKREKIRNMTHISLYAVLLVVCSWISVPLVTPITLQTFGVLFLFFHAGAKKGLTAISLYIALGAIGLPVFSGFGGGIAVLFGATGGYIWGFLAAGGVYFAAESILKEKISKPLFRAITAVCLLLTCYALGALGWVYYNVQGFDGYFEFFKASVLIYALPDAVKTFLASFLDRYIKRVKA